MGQFGERKNKVVNVSVPPQLLDRIDSWCVKNGFSRSTFFCSVSAQYLDSLALLHAPSVVALVNKLKSDKPLNESDIDALGFLSETLLDDVKA